MNALVSRLSRSPGVLSQQLKPDEPTVVLLHPQSGEYYTLDEVGSKVWHLCDGSHSMAEIVALIGQEFDAPADVIETDVLELVKDLVNEKLLVQDP